MDRAVKIKKTSSLCRGILSRNEMEPYVGNLGFKSRCQQYLNALTCCVFGSYNAPCGNDHPYSFAALEIDPPLQKGDELALRYIYAR